MIAHRYSNHEPAINPKPHPGADCIQVTEQMHFNTGTAIQYLWRADTEDEAVEDLKIARWYIDREICRRSRMEQEEPSMTFAKPPAVPVILPLGENTI